jgi:amino acid adenylation domain-containing protein
MNSQNKNIEAIYPLSPMQQGMLFQSLYNLNYPAYVSQFVATIRGNIDKKNFRSAWQETLNRHAALRTVFVWEDLQKPLQVVRSCVELPWTDLDWSERTEIEQQSSLESFLEQDQQQNFSLTKAPLIRVTLIRLGEKHSFVVWTFHHLLIDGWCLPLILKDVWSLYEAKVKGFDCLSLALLHPYRNYITWLQQRDKNSAEAFWRKKLQGLTTPPRLDVAKPLASSRSSQRTRGEVEIDIPIALTESLQTLVRKHRLTLATLVQGAWAILLSRYSHQEDVLFGTVVSGRPPELPGIESMIGMFVNTLPTRTRVVADMPVIDWLSRFQEEQLEQQEYFDSSLIDIQGWSEISRDIPLLETVVAFENHPIDHHFFERSNTGLTLDNPHVHNTTELPITLTVIPDWNLWLQIDYDPHRFDPEMIARMLGHLQTLLEGIAERPSTSIGQLPMLTEAERQQILIEWNDTARNYPCDKYVHQLFEEQVERTPDAIAVVYGEKKLTYRALNTRANQLGHYLTKIGVGTEAIVGICLERSLEMIVALLGVLKAGGAYLPIDPDSPCERLAFILDKASVHTLLTGQSLKHELALDSEKIVTLDTEWSAIALESPANLDSVITGENLAYTIYTSGSTGQPKGVLIPHRGLLNLVHWHQEAFSITRKDRATQLANSAFDASVWEIWPYLVAGASIDLVPSELTFAPIDLQTWLLDRNITVTFLPTPLAERLLLLDWPRSTSLRLLLTGGDRLSQYPPSDLPFLVVNNYGPTENSVVTTSTLVTPADEMAGAPSIGRPISNVRVYILDRFLAPVPIGVSGELYIGGDGLARGYCERTELTAEKFIPDPFSESIGSRLYRTGDIVRYLPDGNIEYLGRIDHQVKIRGFRIETGEVEAALSQYSSIDEVTVIVCEDHPGDKRLVAYLISHENTPRAAELRNFLKSKLPDYMIPSAFVSLEAFPLTPNGKIDRNALANIPISGEENPKTYLAPRNATEEVLVKIIAEILQLDRVGVGDNFFDLGGHSLLATRVISKIRMDLKVDLPIRSLFETPTIADLARAIEALQDCPPKVDRPAITKVSRESRKMKISQ